MFKKLRSNAGKPNGGSEGKSAKQNRSNAAKQDGGSKGKSAKQSRQRRLTVPPVTAESPKNVQVVRAEEVKNLAVDSIENSESVNDEMYSVAGITEAPIVLPVVPVAETEKPSNTPAVCAEKVKGPVETMLAIFEHGEETAEPPKNKPVVRAARVTGQVAETIADCEHGGETVNTPAVQAEKVKGPVETTIAILKHGGETVEPPENNPVVRAGSVEGQVAETIADCEHGGETIEPPSNTPAVRAEKIKGPAGKTTAEFENGGETVETPCVRADEEPTEWNNGRTSVKPPTKKPVVRAAQVNERAGDRIVEYENHSAWDSSTEEPIVLPDLQTITVQPINEDHTPDSENEEKYPVAHGISADPVVESSSDSNLLWEHYASVPSDEVKTTVDNCEYGFRFKVENRVSKGRVQYYYCRRLKVKAKPQCQRKLMVFIPNGTDCNYGINLRGVHTCLDAKPEDLAKTRLSPKDLADMDDLLRSGIPVKDIKKHIKAKNQQVSKNRVNYAVKQASQAMYGCPNISLGKSMILPYCFDSQHCYLIIYHDKLQPVP